MKDQQSFWHLCNNLKYIECGINEVGGSGEIDR